MPLEDDLVHFPGVGDDAEYGRRTSPQPDDENGGVGWGSGTQMSVARVCRPRSAPEHDGRSKKGKRRG